MNKKIAGIVIGAMSILLLAGCGGSGGNTETTEPAGTTEVPSEAASEDKAGSDSSEAPKETEEAKEISEKSEDTASKEKKADTEAQDVSSKIKAMTLQQCEDEIKLLLGTESVHPKNAEILQAMSDCATTAGVIDKSGVIFAQMSNDERSRIRYRLLEAVIWWNSEIYEDMAVKIDDDTWGMPLEDARKMFMDAYGEDDFSPAEREEIKDDKIVIPFADGEAVDLVVGRQFFEDEDYILLSGPLFYESNGEGELFLGCADILFVKNTDSKFGATLVYGRCRDVDINIASVEASSELAGSGEKSYSVNNLIDGDPSTVWVEGVHGTGVGETITLHLDKKQPVYGIQLVNGYTAGYEQFTNNGTLTSVKVDFGEGKTANSDELWGYGNENFSPQDFADMNRFRIGLDEPVITDTITITITGADKGAKYDDTCVSEIWVYGPGEVK